MEQQASDPGSDAHAPPRFLFVGGNVSIDFVNTQMIESGREVDRISTPQELAAWVAASNLCTEFGVPTDIASTIYTQAIDLRGGAESVLQRADRRTTHTITGIEVAQCGSRVRSGHRSPPAVDTSAAPCTSRRSREGREPPALVAGRRRRAAAV